MLPQMVLLHYFSWLSCIPVHVCMCACACVRMCVCVCMHKPYIFFIQSSVDGYLGFFHILSAVNSAAMNIVVHVSFPIRVSVFSRYIFRSGIAGSSGSSVCSCLRILHTVLPIDCTHLHFTNNVQGFPFLCTLSSIYSSQVLLMMAILTSVRRYFSGVLICISLIIRTIC